MCDLKLVVLGSSVAFGIFSWGTMREVCVPRWRKVSNGVLTAACVQLLILAHAGPDSTLSIILCHSETFEGQWVVFGALVASLLSAGFPGKTPLPRDR